MAQMPTPEDEPEMPSANGDDDDTLRKRLLSRIAVAGVAIVGLLGGLAVFDSLNKPQAPVIPKMASAPAEAEKPEAKEEKPVEEKPVEAKAEEKPEEKGADSKVASSEPVPEKTETPIAPAAVEKPQKLAKPVTPPASARAAAIKPAEPAAAPVKPDAKREIARVMPEDSRSGRVTPAPAPATSVTHAPASRPLTQAAETARRFLVQIGVFSNHANAEELVAKLQEAGIPARIESRVQVGPFATRAEVDAARAKLKSLGIDDGMLVRR